MTNRFQIISLVILCLTLAGCSSSNGPTTENTKLTGTLYYNTLEEFHKINLSTGVITKIDNARGPSVLADGRILCVELNVGLAIISANGAQKQIVLKENHDIPLDILYDDFFHDPQQSPDKQYIAYDNGNQAAVCYVVDLIGNLLLTIGDEKYGSKVRYERPVWGKDGSIFVQGEKTFNNGIYKIDKDFQFITRIDPNLSTVSSPTVSPDGATIAFVVNGDIWLMGTDGSNAHQLTTGKSSLDFPTWSPDGKWIACQGPIFDIVFVPVGGGTIILSSQAVPNLYRDEVIGGYQMDWK